MTNAMIILNESVKLMENGVISGTGEVVTITNADGTTKQIEMPEPLHTFQSWKALGYSVKKGEKAVAKFPIWKHTTKTVADENNEEKERTAMYMKMASFFKQSQVEKIVEKGA